MTEMHPHRIKHTYQEQYVQTLKRATTLEEQRYTVVSIWEHEIDRLVQINADFKTFIQQSYIQSPLNHPEALYRGRTNTT